MNTNLAASGTKIVINIQFLMFIGVFEEILTDGILHMWLI